MHWTIFSGGIEVVLFLPVVVSQACYHFKARTLLTSKLTHHYTATKTSRETKRKLFSQSSAVLCGLLIFCLWNGTIVLTHSIHKKIQIKKLLYGRVKCFITCSHQTRTVFFSYFYLTLYSALISLRSNMLDHEEIIDNV